MVHQGLYPGLGVQIEGSGVKWNRVQENENKGQGERSQSPRIFCALLHHSLSFEHLEQANQNFNLF